MQCRKWSNQELKKFAPKCEGRIVNVSGWKDDDKEGHKYREYFSNATEYKVTNFSGERGYQQGDIMLDLEDDLPKELVDRFDVVFNHTTLEHIFELNKAFGNLCKMTIDLCIIIVPEAQNWHGAGDYGDYWRFTHQALEKLFWVNFMAVEHINRGETPDGTYLFCIASKKLYENQPW